MVDQCQDQSLIVSIIQNLSSKVSSANRNNSFSKYISIHIINTIFTTDSPYGDVSGIPDPYNGAQMMEENLQNQTPTHFYNGQHGQQQMSFEDGIDGSGQNGYITPNAKSKRIVREIIV